ncbi:fused MFS/spermidine synthase [Legionella spiritensis]|uniref:Spermidine synthase n=1 Tax=Legionella spiritensis TaxID=452 RepID=A0A0W0Z9Z1_LEGSP|nr:fused MFS/spermidine synthase [Legionella spiritensis]KTD65871.1 spermidine synthase [Legionella spiritensis]SNV32131.1 spermidine synthase [Legionella spiritensis]
MLQTLLAILLLEGFVTISVEILTIRQLIPFFGNSVIITSIIIGFFLLFLALGYWRGGSYQHDFYRKLSNNFIRAMIWIGIGLSYVFILFFYYLTAIRLLFPYWISLTLYLLLVLAPIVYWLGQTIPLTTNLFNQQLKVSHISGRALFLSTIGSFLGALVTSLLLFQYLGVAWTVFINCLLLYGLIIQLRSSADLHWGSVLMLLIVILLIMIININYEKKLFKLTNNYANYQVLETKEFNKVLQINLSGSSMLSSDRKAYPYIEFIRNLLFEQLQLRHKKILVIGAGGFSLTASGTNNNEVTYVDIDPDIKELAEKHFLGEPVSGRFVGQDARLYLNQDPQRFDVIVSDVYSNQATVPESMLTREYFRQLDSHLKPHGFIVVNIIASPFFRDTYSKRVYNTVHQVFPFCAVIPLHWHEQKSNVIYICGKQSPDKSVYRDDLNSATFDYFTGGF